MNCPENLKYTKSHEWVCDNGDGTYTAGITDHAQHLLGDMVFVQLPEVGNNYAQGADCAVVESVKSASDVYAPIAGEVIAINEEVVSTPELINQDAYKNWIWKFKTSDKNAFNELLSASEYQKIAESE